MQTIPSMFIAVVALAASVRSQSEGETGVRAPVEIAPAMSGPAHILGNLPDGTPPPPSPPKPVFVVPPQDILTTATHQQGGRTITIQKIKPIVLPTPPEPAQPLVNIDNAAFRERAAAYRAQHPSIEMLRVGATIYRSKTSPARSLVRIWPFGGEKPVDFWSSADFGYLSGFPSFVGSDGKGRSLFMMWTNADLDNMALSKSRRGLPYTPPEIPAFADGPASFAFIGQLPSDRIIASVQALHDVYNNEFTRLKSAYEGRQRAHLLRAAYLKAHPPQPKDIVINYWRIDKPSQADADQGDSK